MHLRIQPNGGRSNFLQNLGKLRPSLQKPQRTSVGRTLARLARLLPHSLPPAIFPQICEILVTVYRRLSSGQSQKRMLFITPPKISDSISNLLKKMLLLPYSLSQIPYGQQSGLD